MPKNTNNTLAVKEGRSALDHSYKNDKNSVVAEAMAFDSCDTGKISNK